MELLFGGGGAHSQCNCMLTRLAWNLSDANFKGCVMLEKNLSFLGSVTSNCVTEMFSG